MTEEEILIRQRLKDDFKHFAQKCLKIRTKHGVIEPFILNKAQSYTHQQIELQKGRTGKVRALVLKGRQQGMSTYIGGRYYHRTIHNFGTQTFILTHELGATDNLFKMAKRYYENTPELVRPSVSTNNTKELIFGTLDSGYKLGTAENKSVGRSATIQLFHGSEVAFWSNAAEHAKGILQAVPDSVGTEIILESTANGVGNYFHQAWQKAEAGLSDFIAIFVPWFWQEEYTRIVEEDFIPTSKEEELIEQYSLSLEQIAWRRYKIIDLSVNGQDGEKSFNQEYPCLVGSQRVGTNLGLLPISDIMEGYKTNTGVVMRQWCTGTKETIEIETELGYTLKCTPDHRIAIAGGFVEARNSIGHEVNLSIPMFAEKYPQISWNHLPCLRSSVIFGKEFALFLGFFMGDGSYGGEVLSIAFDKKDVESIKTCKELIINLFGRLPQERKTSENGIEIRIHLKALKQMFFELKIIEKRPGYMKRIVCVPDIIWRSPKNLVREFLRGLFDSDGFAGYETAKISFFTKHKQFAKDVQLLLLGFGITCKRGQECKKGTIKNYLGNVLTLRASEARLFGQEIGFVSERKNDRVRKWQIPSKVGRGAPKIKYFDRVENIIHEGQKLVYDLEMDNDNHVFDASGFLVHNCNSAEAFQLTGEDSFIDSAIVMRARKTTVEPYGPLILGVDPARFGDDRTSFIYRQGRRLFKLESFSKKDTMEVAGLVHRAFIEMKPNKICIDVGGLGAGVVDRCKELIPPGIVVPINGGESPLDGKKYLNKRAECWGEFKEWLNETPCQLPDDDSLQADICGIKYKYDSNSRLCMEKKEDMKKRGIRSPDEADAACLTFALPPSAYEVKKENNVLSSMAQDFARKQQAIKRSRM